VVALARIGVLFFDYGKKKVVPIPGEVRERVKVNTPGTENRE
jgi:hypothetical protein